MAKQGKIIRNGIVYSGGGGCDIEYLTQAEYDALPDSKLTNGVEYRITDSNPPAPTAKDMSYDNSESGLEAETVQDAIDSVNESLEENKLIFNSGSFVIPSIAQGMYASVTAQFDKPFKTTNYLFFAYSSDGGFTGYAGYGGSENYGKFTDKCIFKVRNVDIADNPNREIFWEAIGY